MWAKILKNALAVLTSNILLLASSLGLYAAIGRVQGPEGLGEFSFVLAFIGLFAFLPDFGLNLYLIREVAKNRDLVQSYLNKAITLVLLLSPLSYFVIYIISSQLDVDPDVKASIYLAGVYLIIGALLNLMRASFHAYERMEYETIIVLVERLGTFFSCLLLLWLGYGLIALICAHIVARLIALVLAVSGYSWKIGSFPRFSFDKEESISMLRHSMPFALNIMTTSIYVQADLILLSLWISDEASGYYRAATSLIVPLAVIAASLNSAMFPRITREFTISPKNSKRLLELSMRYLMTLGWPIALGIVVLAPAFIKLVYGADFEPSIRVLQVLAFIIPLRFINNTMGNGLTAVNRQKIRATIILTSAILNLLLNLILIPQFSYMGASFSTVATEMVITLALYLALSTSLGWLTFQKKLLRIIVCGLIMMAVTYLLRDTYLVIVIIVSALTYGLTLILFKALPQQEILKMRQATQDFLPIRFVK
jgi:O-antigen/teichoic acid export membrane protein